MKKSKKADSIISTFLGANTSIEGIIDFQGSIRIDGNVKGKIFSSQGSLIVGEDAVINADITVDSVTVMGEINGAIDAGSKIDAHPPAKITGDLHSPVISIKAGVILNGKCNMKKRSKLNEKITVSEKEKPVNEAVTLK